MKNIFVLMVLAMSVWAADARVVLKDTPRSPFGFYRTTESAVRQAVDRSGIDYELDKSGNLKLYFSKGDIEYRGLLIFSRFKGSRVIKRITILAGFGTKPERYNDMITYVNNWNKTRVMPRLYMLDGDSLRLEVQIPARYGFNPDQLIYTLKLFNAAMFYIARQTSSMRR